jgi:Pyridoxamine 5'-phosphate oxidase
MRGGTGFILPLGVVLMAGVSPARAELPATTEEALRSAKEIYVATRRANGEPSAAKPIWFYYMGDGQLFFSTSPGSWKEKRIARGSPLYIWVGSTDGPYVLGEAKPATDPALVDRMGDAYAEKYWIAWLGFFKPRSARVTEGKTKAYIVTLREGEPPAAGRK